MSLARYIDDLNIFAAGGRSYRRQIFSLMEVTLWKNICVAAEYNSPPVNRELVDSFKFLLIENNHSAQLSLRVRNT